MGSRIIPTLKYERAPEAIDWLCRAFGFARHLVVEGEAGIIEHAQLTIGDDMIMLGSVRDSAFDALQTTPRGAGGMGTQSAYIIVDDVPSHHARAVAAGAEIVMPLEAQHYGGAMYSCRDPEGHVWSFGSYDPWVPVASPPSS